MYPSTVTAQFNAVTVHVGMARGHGGGGSTQGGGAWLRGGSKGFALIASAG